MAKQVILIGDSIRMGYQDTVREELADVADVWVPEANGGNSRNVLSHLEEWALARDPAVVHLNCGLHDLKKDFDSGEPAVPLEEYESSVRQILCQLKERTRATVIWAMTTPVNEEWHHARKGFDRFEADVEAYNKAAVKVAEELELPIDDLLSVVMEAGRDEQLTPDGVHFTEAGRVLLGKAVAKFIRGYL